MTTIYAVIRWHTPWVSHGYEPQEPLYLRKEAADARAAELNARDGIGPINERYAKKGKYTVAEWEVEE